ncbi:Lon protease family protein [Thiomicrospira sp. S5]|jgi:Lon-like ATP-dependent protease|uniref:Lon protease family protein n=1 Tax=Thiomicrospira sp. S5 TaxID=1803865 RepID=UPI0004A6EA5F|nr:ATP-binding protein [Thiomicrospira sp. S5]AZR82316.1 ATP-dependent protease [Thiomicrospira sp. S5]
MRKLSAPELYRFTQINSEEFHVSESDTKEFMQRFHPRAFQSLNFGLHLKRNQNHIFIMGEPGVGRIGMTKSMLREAAKRKDIPQDVVLVSDFSEANKTQYLYFQAGHGHGFKQAVEELITQLKTQLPVVFDGHAYQLKNQQLENELAQKQESALEPALDLAESLNIEVQQNENNFVLFAVVEGERLRMADLKKLDEPLQRYFMDGLDQVEEALNKGLTHFPFLQHEFMDAGKKLNTQVANEHLEPLVDSLKMEFGENPKIKDYLDSLKEAIVSKLHLFWDQSAEQVTSAAQTSMEELLAEQSGMSVFEVNLLIDHSGLKHAPVIYEQNATMPKLFGYTINSASANATDTLTLAMNHQAGLLQKANGGFLMLSVQSVLKDPEIWSHLKAALMSKRLTFEIPSSSSVVPYHLPDYPLDVTLVLIGQAQHFYALQEIDAQFNRLFKVQVEFEVELERTPEHELVLAKQLASEVEAWEDLPVRPSALERLIEYASRLVESQGRLYTNKAILRDVLAEANAFARAHDKGEVTREIIEDTILQRDFHTGLMEDYYHRAIIEEQVLIKVSGHHVGMVNGLTVLTVGRQSFGQPVRITAQASAGDEGVVDIEREIEMAGPIHSKGMLILSGYVRGRYMKLKPLGFSASIVMEQTYDGVEGDSASSAELLALISSLSQVPLRQDIAVTGSVNQFGEIQPIGGVNEKVEGFFKVCKARGLTGQQGVIIPEANTKHLMLNAEVRGAVEKGDFHVYAMSHIDDALGLLADMPVGEEREDGTFPEGSINARVMKSLEKMNEKDSDHHH